ncbi:BTAD domain-containing putative transcriptional regulator [Streptomyces sp. NPDC001680]
MMAAPPTTRRSARRMAAVVRFLASGTVLAAAVAGIPYVLLATIGCPWPDQVTSLDDLVTRLGQPVGDPFVLKCLALVGWAFWAYFMAVLSHEALWLAARLPALVADAALLRRRAQTLPLHRAAVAILVGSLLLAVISMWRLPAAHAATPLQSPAMRPAVATAPRQVAPAKGQEPGHTTYIVKPGDALWDIAEQHLGDPLKWPQIYQLSCTIRQTDGHLLSDPDLILPGWRLHLPTVAPPATDRPKPPEHAPAQRPLTSTPAPAPEKPQHSAHADHGDARRHEGHVKQERQDKQRPVTISLGTASAIGVTTAAGIAAAIGFARWHAARRRTPRLDALAAPLEDDDALLGEALSRSNQAHLKARAARHHDPGALPRRTAPAEPGQPGTVSIAEQGGREVHLDTLAQPGGVQLAGEGAAGAARHLALAIASAAERLRPSPPRVQLIVDEDLLRRLLPGAHAALPAWTVTDTVTAGVDAAEHALLEHHRHEQHLDNGTLQDGVPALHVLLTDAAGQDLDHLNTLARRATPGHLAVIVLGQRSPHAQHYVTIAADGTATSDLSALHNGTMFLLEQEPATEILGTLYAAHGHQRKPSDSGDERDDPEPEPAPAPKPEPLPGLQAGLSTPKTPENVEQARLLHIRLFGGFKLFAGGKECALADTRKEETREFITLLAAHQSGLRGEEIAEKMQLSDDPNEAKGEIENLRRAARRVFRSATRKKEVAFVLLSGQVHRLDPQYISTDVAAFINALKQATTADSPYERAAALGRATQIYAGPLCDGADYLWAHGLRTELHRRALDALTLLAEHTAQHSADPEPALALLNQAANLDPENEGVYRRIIQLQLALGRDDAAHRTLTLLIERLAHIDAEPEPATLALLGRTPPGSRSMPGRPPARGGSTRR